MILDAFLAFAPSSNPFIVPNAAGTTVFGPGAGGAANAQDVDLGLGLQTTSNPLGLAIPGVAAGGGARDIGVGDQPSMKILVEVVGTTGFTSAGSTTAQIQILGAPDNGSGAPGTFTVFASGPTITTVSAGVQQPAGAVGGRLMDLDVPRQPEGTPMPRYLQLQIVTTGTGTGNPGTLLEGFIVLDRFDQPWGSTGVLSGYVPGITIPN
jgi:hypothetical protein